MVEQILFYVFGIAAVFSAILVITRRNPVNSAVSLLATFASVAALFILMNAPFIAMIQITVYAGAILVLFLFVVMLLNLREAGSGFFDITGTGQRTAAFLVIAVLGGELLYIILRGRHVAEPMGVYSDAAVAQAGNTQALGNVLFSAYVWPFEVVSILLIVAIVGAVILTQKSRRGDSPNGDAAQEEEDE